jgi:alkylation response protein AidB-like acyl-CoA dehydrogenase
MQPRDEMRTQSEELGILRSMAREWIREKLPVSRYRAMRDAGDFHDASLWREMTEMGWAGVLVPESHGGSAMGSEAAAILCEELGRSLAPTPFLATAIGAVVAIRLAGDDAQQAEWLPRIAHDGEVVAMALDGRFPKGGTLAQACREGAGWRLSGEIGFVPMALAADHLVLPAHFEGEDAAAAVRLFVLPASALDRKPLSLVDQRDYATLRFAGLVPFETALAGRLRLDDLERIADQMALGVAAEMIGVAQEAFDRTIDYIRTREQFGRPIGAFQALQHRAGQMFIGIELARAALNAALETNDIGNSAQASAICTAKAMAGDALHLVSNEAIQFHGGIGMTDEHDIGLYLKRARTLEHLYGSAALHRRRFASLQGF